MVDLGMFNSCRRLKEHFSDSNDVHETSIVFVKEGRIITYKYKLNRESFNNIISQKVADAINVAKAVIKQTEAKQLKIDKVLLIGGSSQLTLVRKMLTDVLPNATIDTCGEKDIAVALGNIVGEQIIIDSQPVQKESEEENNINEDIVVKPCNVIYNHEDDGILLMDLG